MLDPSIHEARTVFRCARLAGDVLSDTLTFLRDEFADLGRSLLYIAGPAVALIVLLSSTFQQEAFELNPLFNPEADPDAVFSLFGPAYFLTIALQLVASVLIWTVGFAYVLLYMEGVPGRIEVGEVWDRAKRLLALVFFTTLGLYLLMIASMLIWLIPCLGTLAWMAAWIWLIPAAALLVPARLIDERDFFSAFRRARHLVEGYWLQTFGVLILVGVVGFVLALAVSLPFTILWAVVGFNGGAGAGPLVRGLMTVGSLISSVGYFAYVLFPVAFTMHYFNLVTKQEGATEPGLEDRVDAIVALEAEDAQWNDEADARDWSGRAEEAEEPNPEAPDASADDQEVDGGDARWRG